MKTEIHITPLFGSIFAAVPVHANFEKFKIFKNFKSKRPVIPLNTLNIDYMKPRES